MYLDAKKNLSIGPIAQLAKFLQKLLHLDLDDLYKI